MLHSGDLELLILWNGSDPGSAGSRGSRAAVKSTREITSCAEVCLDFRRTPISPNFVQESPILGLTSARHEAEIGLEIPPDLLMLHSGDLELLIL